jgi:tetratricopeptide (TPR) repeat protein
MLVNAAGFQLAQLHASRNLRIGNTRTMSRRKTAALTTLLTLSTLLCLPLLSGCACLPLVPLGPRAKSAQKFSSIEAAHNYIAEQEAAHPVPTAADPLPIARSLPPFQGGKGVLVCEPVMAKSSAGAVDLATGCGRWLMMAVGGQGELGRTPLLSSIFRTRRELKRTDLELRPEDLSQLHGKLDVTHVATGEWAEDGTHGRLTYRLYAFPSLAAVGEPVTVEGTEAEVIRQLPGLARKLAEGVGVRQPEIRASVGMSGEELRLVGRVLSRPEQRLEKADLQRLRGLAARLPLAGLAYTGSADGAEDGSLHQYYVRMLDQSPRNAAVLGAVGWGDASALAERASLCEAAARRFPHNNQLAHTEVWLRRMQEREAAERAAAQRTVRCAPEDPDAWLTLAETIADSAHRIRQGRFYDDLRANELPALERSYADWLQAARRAAQLDPLDGHAWLRVATAASFASDKRLAEAAFWNALRLSDDPYEVYGWGLEMFQTKWGGDPATLETVSRLAAIEPITPLARRAFLAESIRGAGQAAVATEMTGKLESEARSQIARTPSDYDAHYALGVLLKDGRRLSPALKEWRECVRLRPEFWGIRYELAKLAEQAGQFKEAAQEYRETLRLDFTQEKARADLGRVLAAAGDTSGAIDAFRVAEAHGVRTPELYLDWGNLLDKSKQYDEGIRVFQHAVAANPKNSEMHGQLGYFYAVRKQHAASIKESRAAVRLDPKNMTAHENLGDELAEIGQVAAARKEWELVISEDKGRNGGDAQEARQMLAKHP